MKLENQAFDHHYIRGTFPTKWISQIVYKFDCCSLSEEPTEDMLGGCSSGGLASIMAVDEVQDRLELYSDTL